MTMQHDTHPHDERLAALAGADAEATEDRALRDHVASCDRCRVVVNDLRLLRSALAELPDLRPSRPLQLLPPVAAPAAPRSGALGFLRRLTAPAMAAGAALILVGAVGSTGMLQALGGLGSAAAPAGDNFGAEAASSQGGAQPSGGAYPGVYQGQAGSPSPTSSDTRGVVSGPADSGKAAQSAAPVPRDHGGTAELDSNAPPDPRFVWLLILAVGVALLGGSLLLRFTVQPRAG
jgi:hypothetical protein